MTVMNRTLIEILRRDTIAALEEVGKKHGLKMSLGRGKFDVNKLNIDLQMLVIDPSGVVHNPEVEDFHRFATHWGLSSADIGQYFTSNGTRYKIIGAKPQNHKYPIIGASPTGKRFKFTVSGVQRGLLG